MTIRKWLSRSMFVMLFASLALWGGSYARFYYRGASWLVAAQRGSVRILSSASPWPRNDDSVAFRVGWHYMGFRGFSTMWWPAGRRGAGYFLIFVPLWMPVVLSGLLFGFVYPPYRRHMRRKRLGLCLSCGYDLTGNESGVCPECGVPTGSSATA